MKEFKKIEKTNFQYEINIEGVVRNVKSKRVKKTNINSVSCSVKGVSISVHITKTILELFEKEIIQRMNRIGFKQIKRYVPRVPGNYFIDRKGNVFNFYNNVTLKVALDKYGYERVVLDGKTYTLHRLLAQVFIPNPDNKPTVNHIDHVRDNNTLENLEWNDHSEQQNNALIYGVKSSKQVYDIDNDICFVSIGKCAEYHNVENSNVSRLLNKKRKTVRSKRTGKKLNLEFRDYCESK